MPANKLVVQKSARKGFTKLPLNVHKRVVRALGIIKDNPLIGTKLHGELAYYRKFRVGDYRIVYRFEKKTKTVRVVKIEHRRGVYK
jgi:mRNA interferase RelE/StbE